ncbi:MAG: trehalase-like domain-containing protein [Microthrixaceae bacterium]
MESKPTGLAFHYRRADPAVAADAALIVRRGPAKLPGVHVKEGKSVIELTVVDTDKGAALDHIRAAVHADAVLFIGDDLTDEDAFATLRGPDVSVKVGVGETLATHRVADPEEVCGLLARLLGEREAWVRGHRAPPIERHALLSDQRTVALVDPNARVSWLCSPRADSASIFGELLGGPSAGYFAVRPAGPDGGAPAQRYLADTMIVETQWRSVRVTDYLDVSGGRNLQPAGASDLIRVLDGSGPVEIVFAPRLDFGRTVTELELDGPGSVQVVGGAYPIELTTSPPVTWRIERQNGHDVATAEVELERSESLTVTLRLGAEHLGPTVVDVDHVDDVVVVAPLDAEAERERRDETIALWRSILTGLQLPAVAPTQVRRSVLTLEALRYRPSGAMLAAATTSLPECIGGGRNWDYRFCWPRDASMSCTSLARLGHIEPGLALLDWICERVETATRPDLLRPLYAVSGDDHTPEGVVSELAGYAGSRPVRIGNAAENQVQLDALGPVAELVYRIFVGGSGIRPAHWDLLERLADVVVELWPQPDHGIWEVRLARRQHVVSKVNCWQVLDRAVRLAEATGRTVSTAWTDARSAIVEDVSTHGWSDERGCFVSVYGGEDLDAGLLLMGTCGFVDPFDERFVATVGAVEHELCEGSAVYRYLDDDGLAGREGGMLICTGWLVQALAACGRVEDALDWFDRLVSVAGPVGLLPEQIDPSTERGLGNYPQAYSHLAVIDAALALSGQGVSG